MKRHTPRKDVQDLGEMKCTIKEKKKGDLRAKTYHHFLYKLPKSFFFLPLRKSEKNCHYLICLKL